MKRIALVLCGLAAMLSMVTAPGAASAEVVPTVANCNGHTVVSANYVKSLASGLPWGAVQLCRNSGSFFAIFVHYVSYPPPEHGPMPPGFIGNAFLYSVTGGQHTGFWDCKSGNDIVHPNETWCVTAQIPILSGETFRARGVVHQWNGATWVLRADGWTKRCNMTTCWDE